MIKLDHLTIFVSDQNSSRDWYIENFGFEVEFEVPEAQTVALIDDAEFTLFLTRNDALSTQPSCVLTFQVASVEETYKALTSNGIKFEQSPQKLAWGYGAELRDPDGYLIYVWDEETMRTYGDMK